MRSWQAAFGAAMFALAGCDQLWALQHVPERDGGDVVGDGDDAVPIPTCATTLLLDNFDDNVINTSQWYAWTSNPGAQTVEMAQQMLLSLGSGSVEAGRQAELVSLAGFDLRGREASVELTLISNLTTKLQAVLFFRNDPSLDGFALVIEQGLMYFGRRIGGDYQTIGAALAYSATDHRFLHLREAGGRVYYAVSADGQLWHDLADVPVQVSLTNTKVGIYVFMDGDGIDPGYATFDNFKLCELADGP